MMPPLTRREQVEAYADLYDVPLRDIYRRYGAVLLFAVGPARSQAGGPAGIMTFPLKPARGAAGESRAGNAGA